jgi:hypothetical protein
MTTVYQYQIFCVTEQKMVTGWGTVHPTTCYNNHEHEVNLNSVSQIDKVSNNVVNVSNETIPFGQKPTSGNYRCSCLVMSCAPNTTSQSDVVFELPMSCNAIQFNVSTENIGDEVTITAAPNTVIGVLNADVNSGATHIPIQSSMIPYLQTGLYIKLSDGTNLDDMGMKNFI